MNATNILEQLQAATSATTSEQVTNFLHAQSYSAPVEIGAWLACLAFILFLLNQGGTLVAKLRGKPSPEEQAEATADINTSLARIEQQQADHGRRLDAIEAHTANYDRFHNAEHDKLYNKVNAWVYGGNNQRVVFEKIWPRWGSMRSGACWARTPSAHPISASACGYLAPTPLAHEAVQLQMKPTTFMNTRYGTVKNGLTRWMYARHGRVVTPHFTEWMMGWPLGWTSLGSLAMARFRPWLRSHGAPS